MKNKNHCKDCSKIISKKSKRCQKCYGLSERGNKHKNWKGGKPKCLDCGKELSTYNSKYKIYIRCKKCWHKFAKGRNGTRYKNGISLSIHLCKICKKPLINIYAKHCRKHTNQGKLHPNWKNGLSKLPYSWMFNKKLKELIIKRDNYKCKICNTKQYLHIEKYNKKLEVHHIDYNKLNCKEDNLITLCKSCNIKVNYNRDYWFAFFKYIIGD